MALLIILFIFIPSTEATVFLPNPVGEPGFETITGWTYAEVDTGGCLSGGVIGTWFTEGTQSYELKGTPSCTFSMGDYLRISRSVNFTNIQKLTWDQSVGYGGASPEWIPHVYVGTTEITSGQSLGFSGSQVLQFNYSHTSGAGTSLSCSYPCFTFRIDNIKAYTDVPALYSPANNSIQYKVYPPLTADLNFTWLNDSTNNSNILIAKDINFNIISVNTTISNNYSVQALEAGNYWWKVRYYNSTTGTYYAYSNVSNFTLTNNYTTSGKAGVEGIVYEMIGGVQTPISEVTVHLYNTSYSTSMITGSNGYYLFDNLANSSTYSIYAEKQGYDTTAVFPVTTGLGTRTTNNILMTIYISPYVPNFVFEKFIVRGLFDDPYPGVTVTVYKDGDVLPYLSGTTDSMGAVVFQLIKDQYYRVTFSGGGLSSTITVYVYGKEEVYLLTVVSGFPTTPDRNTAISSNLTVFTLNATHSNLSLIYNDTSSTTTGINFTVKNATTGVTICSSSSTSQVIQLNCTVQSIGVYQFGYNATSTTYGAFSGIKYINFGAGSATNPTIPMQGTSPTLLHWGSIILIVIVAALFSIKTVKYGAVVVPFLAGGLWWNGWFQVNGLIIALAVVIGIIVYIRQSEAKVSY